MKRFLGTVILFGVTLGWWGFVYPELCLTPEECYEEQTMDEEEIKPETIRIKSRLYEYICQHKEAAHD